MTGGVSIFIEVKYYRPDICWEYWECLIVEKAEEPRPEWKPVRLEVTN